MNGYPLAVQSPPILINCASQKIWTGIEKHEIWFEVQEFAAFAEIKIWMKGKMQSNFISSQISATS